MTNTKKTPHGKEILELIQNSLNKISHLRDRLDDKKMDFNSFDNELEGIGKTVMAAGWYVKE